MALKGSVEPEIQHGSITPTVVWRGWGPPASGQTEGSEGHSDFPQSHGSCFKKRSSTVQLQPQGSTRPGLDSNLFCFAKTHGAADAFTHFHICSRSSKTSEIRKRF